MKISIIGAGISGLVAACYLAKQGYKVHILEKNSSIGGRARQFQAEGFTFDMGPSWYWMPEVFEEFFNDFGKKASDYYELIRLSPSYKVYFDSQDVEVSASLARLEETFEAIEPGTAKQLQRYLKDAAEKYRIGMGEYARKPSLSITEYLKKDILSAGLRLSLLGNMEKHVNSYFKHPILQKIMQFPVLFLGALPKHIPAMYSLMNYADTLLGTWYPKGGMFEIIQAFYSLAQELGVTFTFDTAIDGVEIMDNKLTGVKAGSKTFSSDYVICSGDYHHFETILPEKFQSYSPAYWDKRKMAPSSVIYYLGFNKKLPLNHHSLFFDSDFNQHAKELYDAPQWPSDPMFYVCAPSVTDATVAPEGKENLFILIPIAAGLPENTKEEDPYLSQVIQRLEKKTGVSIAESMCYKRKFSISDFQTDYYAFKGNAYGLANTLDQTAFFKPRIKSKKIRNLYYTGQLTVPGPGVPPAILSGRMVAQNLISSLKKGATYE